MACYAVSAHMSVLIMVFRGGLCCWPTLLAEVVSWSRHSPQRQSPAGPSAYLSVPLPTGGAAAGVRGEAGFRYDRGEEDGAVSEAKDIRILWEKHDDSEYRQRVTSEI